MVVTVERGEVEMGHGAVVVVTGAGSGIGRAVAEELMTTGSTVVAVGRRPDPLHALADSRPAGSPDGGARSAGSRPAGSGPAGSPDGGAPSAGSRPAGSVGGGAVDGGALPAGLVGGGEVLPVPMDVTRAESPGRLRDLVCDRYGRVDGLVNCAGLARFAKLESACLEDLDRMLAINLRAPAALIQAFLPALRESGGSVVNVTSVGGVLAMPGRAFYGASKAAINSLTRSLAQELAPRVRVNAVVPGPVDTPMYDDLGLDPEQTESLRAGLMRSTPMARFGRTDEVARWVCALLDPDRSGWVTGALFAIDGGRTA